MKKRFLSMALASLMMVSALVPAYAEQGPHELDVDYTARTETEGETVIKAGSAGFTPVLVTAEATNFDVVVPLSLLLSVDKDGVATAATNAKIINNSYGAVKLNAINVAANTAEGWELGEYEADMSNVKVGTKRIGFAIKEFEAVADTLPIATGKDAYTLQTAATPVDTQAFENDALGQFGVIEGVGAKDEASKVVVVAAKDAVGTEGEDGYEAAVEEFAVYGNEMLLAYHGTVPAQKEALDGAKAADVIFTIDWDME